MQEMHVQGDVLHVLHPLNGFSGDTAPLDDPFYGHAQYSYTFHAALESVRIANGGNAFDDPDLDVSVQDWIA